ncbi:MAG: sigma-70 family RNA polymerase sigma factor [Solirubrobacteraceae bacterium]
MALVRRGDPTAFEILYDRHVHELLSFCRYMLGSRADAEDAVQSTFASAHRALLADDRWVDVRPWLFTIARNACLSILRGRRALAEVVGASPPREDPVARVEQREDMRQVLATLRELPENQRTALVLSELHGFSHSEIGVLLGVRPEQVKSYVYQARSNLISEREARNADCRAIREELAVARGPALLKSRLRRHLRSCPGCREYAAEIARQRHQLGILLPVAPSLALKRRALEAVLGRAPGSGTSAGGVVAGGSAAATTAELAGGGAKALIAKLLIGVASLGASTGAATLVLGIPATPALHMTPTSSERGLSQPRPGSSVGPAQGRSMPAARRLVGAAPTGVGDQASQPAVAPPQRSQAPQSSTDSDPVTANSASSPDGASVVSRATSEEAHGKGEEAQGGEAAHGKSEEPHGKSEEAHGKSEEAHGGEAAHGKSEEAHGKSEEAHGGEAAHGKSEEAHGKSEEARGGEAVHGKSEDAHGKSEEAHGKSEEAHGGEAVHGNSEDAHGKSEEAHGKSEEAHGKAKGE